MFKKDLLSALGFLAFGLFLAFQSIRLTVWKHGPETGFFPFVIAIGIMGVSLAIGIRSLLFTPRAQASGEGGKAEKNQINVYKISSYAVLTLFYGIFIGKLGFLLASGIFLVLILRYVEKQSWTLTLLGALPSIIASYLLFGVWLGVPLPRGWIG
jgi:putative tricarboxylic transport membrane protein